MNRLLFTPVVALICGALSVPPAFAQATPAAGSPSQSPPPAAPAKWIPPVKGTATIEVARASRRVGKEMVTTVKIKNTSTGSINLLRIDELWYDAKRELVTSTTERHRKPFPPGEIIEMTLKSPVLGEPQVSTLTFVHANGKVDAKTVKKIE
jgi:hypothetical protein